MSSSADKSRYVSMRRIAELCGVSRMTVSRAFDPSGVISPKVRQRILAVATQEGYEPDRMVKEVMTTFARSRKAGYRETLAALWWGGIPSAKPRVAGYLEQVRVGLDAGAEFHGCRFDHFSMNSAEDRKGIGRVLKARGIRGVVVTPPMNAPDLSTLLPWDQFNAVTIGSSLRTPMLHRTQHNHQEGAVRVIEEVLRRGYRRPLLVINQAFDQRAGMGPSGAFLARYPKLGLKHILFLESDTAPDWRPRLDALSPDVVIADAEHVRSIVSAVPGLDFVSLSVNHVGGDCAGIVQQPVALASAAVDLLLRSRWRGETGVPETPMTLMSPGVWNEGSTLRAMKP